MKLLPSIRIADDAAPAFVDPDAALLAAFARGDAAAAQALTGRLAPRAYAQAYRMLADAAEAQDVGQEAMLRLWRAAADWRHGEARVSSWLYRVVANLCTDRLRRRRVVSPADAAVDPIDPAPSAEAAVLQTARMQALANALALLPARQAEAVALRHLEGLSNPQIAEIMAITVEAVESLTARARRSLAQILAGRKEELGYADE
ncbi:RNA polymerase sigma factor [Ketogulonicigenium robustum]|uniref:RNA polymerase sigma factor n=1 Tax=Ketogulonicigenium robustum TaxID=92947 RepID=UPI003AACB87D